MTTDGESEKDKEKWYRFNDTVVEEFDLSDQTLKTECFGGSYKSGSSEWNHTTVGGSFVWPSGKRKCYETLSCIYVVLLILIQSSMGFSPSNNSTKTVYSNCIIPRLTLLSTISLHTYVF